MNDSQRQSELFRRAIGADPSTPRAGSTFKKPPVPSRRNPRLLGKTRAPVRALPVLSSTKRLSLQSYNKLAEVMYKPTNSFYARHGGASQTVALSKDFVLVTRHRVSFPIQAGEAANVEQFLASTTPFALDFKKHYGVPHDARRTAVDAVPLLHGYAGVDFKYDAGFGYHVSKTQTERCFLFVFKRLKSWNVCEIYKHEQMRGVYAGNMR